MNCIIVDDEPLAREGIKDLIAARNSLVLLRSFSSSLGVLDYVTTHPVELAFLDIEMPGGNGLELAKLLPDSILIVFTTAYAEFALQSYEVEAIDYLVKPVSAPRFAKAVDKAEQHRRLLAAFEHSVDSVTDSFIDIMSERRHYKIPFRNILSIEGIKDFVVVHTEQENYVTWMNLKTMHAKLPQQCFVRVSKRFVVNHEAVVSYDSTTVYLKNQEIALGKAYQQEFYESAQQFSRLGPSIWAGE
ncbi:LytR/AlgR family response regulator transcription factor [Hymenobacter terrenus]|uniref:LytR/AlgR family response regulator transcription factor n=1 Tax=Hymenobacter terrenus TaxID=1629124 RepID=UPI0006198839|nr:LytTR family DNA-binding domain-containing protein [Hymenobacter terrenus]